MTRDEGCIWVEDKAKKRPTLKERELIRISRERGISNKEMCERLGVSYPTLAKWIKRLGLPNRYEEERERNLKEIYSAIERLGCCTIKEVSGETKIPSHTTQKYLNFLLKEGKIEKIAIKRRRRSKLAFRETELFGEVSGSVFFYKDRKEIISRLMETMSRSQGKGIKSALTHYLKSFGFTREEIDVINRGRSIPDGVTSLQLKAGDIEKLQGVLSNDPGSRIFSELVDNLSNPYSFSISFVH